MVNHQWSMLTIWAFAFDDVIDGGHFISIGQVNQGDFNVVQTKGLMTMLTIKMSVHVVIVVVVMTHTQLIAYTVAPVLYHVQQVMLAEEG